MLVGQAKGWVSATTQDHTEREENEEMPEKGLEVGGQRPTTLNNHTHCGVPRGFVVSFQVKSRRFQA